MPRSCRHAPWIWMVKLTPMAVSRQLEVGSHRFADGLVPIQHAYKE